MKKSPGLLGLFVALCLVALLFTIIGTEIIALWRIEWDIMPR